MFSWNPDTRMKPDEALNHEWIKEGMIHVKNRQLRSKAVASNERKRGKNLNSSFTAAQGTNYETWRVE